MARKELTAREQRFVAAYVQGMTAAAAAREAGYGPTHADKAAEQILSRPRVRAAVDAHHEKLRQETLYDVRAAVSEIGEMITYAKSKGNAMACAKLLELKVKLHGLLVDRVEVATVDISGAIADARARVLQLSDFRTAGRIIDAKPIEQRPRAPVDLFED